MAFNIICENCGAPSGHSVGLCPFCKSPMSNIKNPQSATYAALMDSYSSGDGDLAVVQVNKLLQARDELIKNVDLLMLAVKVLLESEAPKTRLSALLAEAMLVHPNHPEVKTYYQICEARHSLKLGDFDTSEQILRAILKREPKNVHACFVLGTHLFWDEDKPTEAMKYLQTCVAQHKNFKRAWGCLGAIFERTGNKVQAAHAFAKFKELETNTAVIDALNKRAA